MISINDFLKKSLGTDDIYLSVSSGSPRWILKRLNSPLLLYKWDRTGGLFITETQQGLNGFILALHTPDLGIFDNVEYVTKGTFTEIDVVKLIQSLSKITNTHGEDLSNKKGLIERIEEGFILEFGMVESDYPGPMSYHIYRISESKCKLKIGESGGYSKNYLPYPKFSYGYMGTMCDTFKKFLAKVWSKHYVKLSAFGEEKKMDNLSAAEKIIFDEKTQYIKGYAAIESL